MDEIEELIEELGRAQTPATKKKIAKAMLNENNPAWKDGRHPDHYRRVAGAKPGDGSVVHHKDKNRHDNAPSNLQKIPESRRGEHDKIHKRARNFKK
jgi:hypothetical protein